MLQAQSVAEYRRTYSTHVEYRSETPDLHHVQEVRPNPRNMREIPLNIARLTAHARKTAE